MENKKQSKLAKVLLGAAIVASLGTGFIGVVSADTTVASKTASTISRRPTGGSRGQGVVGTVVSVSGNTITLTGKDGKTYTINTATAKISKVETITTANIAAGDTLEIGGTVSGTSVTANTVIDGQLPAVAGFDGPRGGAGRSTTKTSAQ